MFATAIRASEVSKPNAVEKLSVAGASQSASRLGRQGKSAGALRKRDVHGINGNEKGKKNGRMLSAAGFVGGLRAPLGGRRVVDILTQGLFQISRALRTIQKIVAGSCTRIRRYCNVVFLSLAGNLRF